MKKINLKGISEILSEKEMKNVLGGSGGVCDNYHIGQPCTRPYSNGCITYSGICTANAISGYSCI